MKGSPLRRLLIIALVTVLLTVAVFPAEFPRRLVFMTDRIQRATVDIRPEVVLTRRVSRISPMPEGLANSLTEDEIWDLIAYLPSGPPKLRGARPKNE